MSVLISIEYYSAIESSNFQIDGWGFVSFLTLFVGDSLFYQSQE